MKNEKNIYDIIVAGGGPAGLAAAVGAARCGSKVLLIEKNGYIGGMGTINGAICGLYTSSKNKKLEQLVQGFAGEFYEEMKKKNGVAIPYPFGDTNIVVHDHLVWREVADELLEKAGVEVIFHTIVTDVIKFENEIKGIVIENKAGRMEIFAKRFIDCTGDGDVAVKAGVPYTIGKNGNIQYATMIFRMGNVDVKKATSYTIKEIEELINIAISKGYNLPRKHIYILPSPRPNEIVCNMTAITNRDGSSIDSTDAKQMSFGEIEGRKQVREYERFLKEYISGFENAILVDVGNELGIRQSRTIQCKQTLTNKNIFESQKFEHSIAKSAWCIEAHGKDGIFMYYLEDDFYEIPYETMLPLKIDNLMVAGRLICAEHEALASARVVAQCLLTGYAAGVGSSLSLQDNCYPKDVEFSKIKAIIDY